MELIDTHCHIHEIIQPLTPVYEKWHKGGALSIDSVLAGARAAGVGKMICVGTTVEDSQLAAEFVADRPECWASAGIHPHAAQRYVHDQKSQRNFRELLSNPKIVAVGECGLDYFYGYSPKADQLAMLRFQIELALEHDLPLSFHVREAFDDFWPVFESYQGVRGVLHSYTDNRNNLERALGHGLYIGVNGIATFSNKPQQMDMYQAIPLDRLLLETDAPFLTPVPYRGTICEPKHVRVTAEYLAKLREVSLDVLADKTSGNARSLFGI